MFLRLSMMLAPLMAIGVLLFGVKLVDAGSYRWVDAQRDVHYGDSVPAEQVRMGYGVYDTYWRELSVVEAARSKQDIELALKRDAKAAEQARRDRILLATFTSEEDIKFVRNDRLASLNSAILITQEKLAELQLQHAGLEAQAQSYDKKKEPVPAVVTEGLERLSANMTNLQTSRIATLREKRMLEKTFAADLGRFRKLKAQ
ncbi:MAG: hypothetical protein H0V62_00090 [Gammaproteobacteria bacterium]|nr:hypothetical protein [Gammaproteobacteria bacterium]